MIIQKSAPVHIDRDAYLSAVPLCLDWLTFINQLFNHSQLLNLITEDSSAFAYYLFSKVLKGAFQKTKGLNHFQQVVVLSNKHRLLTSPYLRVYCVRLLFTTILHFRQIVNIKYFANVVLFYPYLIMLSLLVNLDHVFVQLQLHE